jgi:CheY-like chemotaxis protein
MAERQRAIGKRILVVEDEPLAREVLTGLLRLDEHIVTEAENGNHACLLYTPGDFDLVITDYKMPQMNGDEFARAIKCLVPKQRILMITAYAAELWGRQNPVDAIMPKPYSLAELRQTIAELLVPKRTGRVSGRPQLKVGQWH